MKNQTSRKYFDRICDTCRMVFKAANFQLTCDKCGEKFVAAILEQN